jgi:hypothetical protein
MRIYSPALRASVRHAVLTTLAALLVTPMAGFAATAIDANSLTSTTTPGTASSYVVNGRTYNFGQDVNRLVTGFDVGGTNYAPIADATEFRLQRNPGSFQDLNRTVLWYDQVNSNATTTNLRADYAPNMETALLGRNFYRGTDNIFSNQGDTAGNPPSGGNNNNIERADYLIPVGLRPNAPNQLNFGLLLLERNGNDNIGIAAIRTLDGSGNPTSYYAPHLVTTPGQWGTTGVGVTTPVLNSGATGATPATPGVTTTVSGQSIYGSFVSLNDLGLTVGDTFYGYSLFAVDTYNLVAGNGANLVDPLNTSYFPTDTSSSGTTGGGLDLIAGGVFFEDGSGAGDFVLPEPSQAIAACLALCGAIAPFSRRRSRLNAQAA